MPDENKIIMNERLMPMDYQFMADREVDFEVYAKMQLESKWNIEENHRYMYKKDFKPSRLEKEIGGTEKTIRKRIKYLVSTGYVKEDNEKKVYLLPDNGYTFYTKIPYKELEILCNHKEVDSDTIKIYAIIKGFTEDNGKKCNKSRETIAKDIGLSPKANKNLLKISKKIELLKSIGLIEIEKVTTVKNGVTKTILYKWCTNRNSSYYQGEEEYNPF